MEELNWLCLSGKGYQEKGDGELINYDRIISIVREVHDSECDLDPYLFASKYNSFPLKCAYDGQDEAIETIIKEDRTLLCSHTGSGKSACFLTAAHELQQPTLVIEPRKFLQKQISEYFNDFVIYGKGEYPCEFAPSAASAPCKLIHEEKGRRYFTYNYSEKIPYPCPDCEYIKARRIANNILLDSYVLITNFGNFWQYVRLASFVVIDEADLFFQSISSGIPLEYILDVYNTNEFTIKELLDIEEKHTGKHIDIIEDKNTINKEDSIKLNQLESKLYKLSFFKQNADICFIYKRKSQVYVEILPDRTSVLLDRLFEGKKVCVVTATPSQFMEVEK